MLQVVEWLGFHPREALWTPERNLRTPDSIFKTVQRDLAQWSDPKTGVNDPLGCWFLVLGRAGLDRFLFFVFLSRTIFVRAYSYTRSELSSRIWPSPRLVCRLFKAPVLSLLLSLFLGPVWEGWVSWKYLPPIGTLFSLARVRLMSSAGGLSWGRYASGWIGRQSFTSIPTHPLAFPQFAYYRTARSRAVNAHHQTLRS